MAIEIYNATDLKNIENDMEGDYILMNDIDIGSDFDKIGEWSFFGTIDGQGYKIHGSLNPYDDNGDYGFGLFWRVMGMDFDNEAVISNLTLDISINSPEIVNTTSNGSFGHEASLAKFINCHVILDFESTETMDLGGFVGRGRVEHVFKNCSYKGTLASGGNEVGGICGDSKNEGVFEDCYVNAHIKTARGGGLVVGTIGSTESTTVKRCYANGIISDTFGAGSGMANNGGGITAYAGRNVLIEQCYAVITCHGIEGEVGGIVAMSAEENGFIPTVRKCFAEVDISGCCVGGLIGAVYTATHIKDCYAVGDVVGTDFVAGGLIGGEWGDATIDFSFENCYAAAAVSGEGNKGGLIGVVNTDPVVNCYYDSEVSGQEDDDGRGIPKTTAEMKNIDTFDPEWDIAEQDEVTQDEYGWNSNYIWGIGTANNGYPFLWLEVVDVLNIWPKIGAIWETGSDIWVKVGAVWKKVIGLWIKKGAEWKEN